MKSNFLKNKIGGALLGVSLLLGMVIASSVTTQAQWQQDRRNDNYGNGQNRDDRNRRRDQRGRRRNDGYGNNGGYNNDGYGNWGGSFDLRQTALNEGFNEGLKEGRNDRRKGDYFNYTDEKEFQKGTKSYSSRLGDRGLYSRYFRAAFAQGYKDGHAGY